MKEAAEAQARQVRESDLKRRRAAEAREASEIVRREEEEAEAVLEAQRLRAKHKLDEQLRRDREAAAECARFNRARTEDKAIAMLKQALELKASSEKELEKANQLRAKAQARLDRRVARERLVLENPGRGISEVDIDTSDDEDFESTVRVSAEVQKLEATGWIEQIRSMWLHQLC